MQNKQYSNSMSWLSDSVSWLTSTRDRNG